MPNTHETLDSLFVDTADAIREKTGGTGDIVADIFPTAIRAIPSGIVYPSGWFVHEWTQATDSLSETFTHNFGQLPRLVICYALTPSYSANELLLTYDVLKPSDNTWSASFVYSSNGSGGISASAQAVGYNDYAITTTTLTIGQGRYYGAKFKAGTKYLLLAFK
jgi:hypothetical protein